MSYDRRRLRGHHPAACTCVRCREGRQRPPAATPVESEKPVWPPRSLSPRPNRPHPTDCSCSECQEKRRRTRQRPGPAISPAFSPQQEAAEQEGAQATEQQEPAQKEQEQQRQIQQTPATPPSPTKPPATRNDRARPNRANRSHSYVCTCQACGDDRERQHREDRAATRPDADTAHVPPLRVPPPRVQSPRVQTPSRRQWVRQRRNPLRTLLKFTVPLVIVALLVAGVVWWTSNSSSEPESGSSTQVTESSGSWFSSDCDNERSRRRGGWLRALLC